MGAIGIIFSLTLIIGLIEYFNLGLIPDATTEEISIFVSYFSALIPPIILIISSVVSIFNKQGRKSRTVIILDIFAIIIFIIVAKFVYFVIEENLIIKNSVIFRMLIVNVVTIINALRK